MTKDIDLDALQTLAEKATPGPWVANHAGCGTRDGMFRITEHYVQRPGDDVSIACDIVDPTCDDHTPSAANAAFIAAANPQTILALIARIRELERRADTGKSAEAAKWTDGAPDNLPAAALDALLWLQYTQARSKLLGMSGKDWGRLDDCIEALQGFLPQPDVRAAPEGGKP